MRKIYKIIFLGNSAVGKTTLISQYFYSKVHNPTPTIGIDFLSTTYEIDGKIVKLQLWDTAGQEKFHSIIGNYTRNTFIAIIVFSVDSMSSVDKLRSWIEDFVLIHNQREKINLIVVGNKIDLENTDKTILERGKSIADCFGAKFITTSALERKGIEEMISVVNQYIIKDLENEDEEVEDYHTKIVLNAKNRKCC